MSSLDNAKLSTEKFIENAVNDGAIHSLTKEAVDDSKKLILDEISNQKFEQKEPIIDNDNLLESSTVKPTQSKEEVESVSEGSEIDLKLTESEEPEVVNVSDSEKEETVKLSDDKTDDDKTEPLDEWQDILGSGVIMKKILKEGEKDSRPQRSDKCFINYTCRLESTDEDNLADKGENYELGLGEGDVVQGLDVAIGLMNKNERCLLKIGARLAFGARGLLPSIPGNSTVIFDVELVNVQKEDDFENLTIQERRRMGNKKRERGNWWYQRGENTLAIQCYRRALDFLDEVENENIEEKPSDTELQQLLEDRLKVLNNMASAQIKMELYDQAQMSLQSVLKCQPDNVKALYRKAKIFLAKNDLGQALKLLEKAKTLEPDDPLIAKEITTVNGLINKQKNSEREYARRMFGGTNTVGTKTKQAEENKRPSNKLQVWATIGASIVIGIAGMVVYKLKYP